MSPEHAMNGMSHGVEDEEWPEISKSSVAKHTTNPIRNVVDRLKVPPNPALSVISLGLGDPTVFGNLQAPESVIKAVQDALLEPRNHGYPPATGYPSAKEAIAARYTRPEAPLTANDVIITSGCSGALEMTFAALASPGQTILLPQPGFSLYRTLCDNKSIKVKYYRLLPERAWEVDLEQVESLLRDDPSIVAWLINNPSNPCGSVYSAEHLRACKQLARRWRLTIVADEIYEDLVFKPNEFHPLATLEPRIPLLTCGGLAKRFLVPGWRTGWILLHDPTPAGHALAQIRSALVDLAGIILGANSVIQASLPAIFQNTPQGFHEQINEYIAGNAECAYQALLGTPGLQLIRPQGAFYMMVGLDMDQFDLKDDVEACEKLVSEESVICLPGMVQSPPLPSPPVLMRVVDFWDAQFYPPGVLRPAGKGHRGVQTDQSLLLASPNKLVFNCKWGSILGVKLLVWSATLCLSLDGHLRCLDNRATTLGLTATRVKPPLGWDCNPASLLTGPWKA